MDKALEERGYNAMMAHIGHLGRRLAAKGIATCSYKRDGVEARASTYSLLVDWLVRLLDWSADSGYS